LYNRRLTSQRMSYVEYFNYMLKTLAINVAIYQAIGFTHDSLHFGQVTLCGEMTDLGIGNFNRPFKTGINNALHEWFRYERQPAIVQNILYKTHAVKAEPSPVLLDRNCRAICEQNTLFSAIRSFSPESATAIEAGQPLQTFWTTYQETYQNYNYRYFYDALLSRIQDYFNWQPDQIYRQLPLDKRKIIATAYQKNLDQVITNYEQQIGTWSRRGPSAIHCQLIFANTVQSLGIEPAIDFTNETNGYWRHQSPVIYKNLFARNANHIGDISWKPNLSN
jgi:hypothetical protein